MWLGALLLPLLAAMPARAQIGSERYSSLVMDARTGAVLSAANPDEPRYPASLTKMMTLYLLFEALRDGSVTLDSRLTMSDYAASRAPSKLGIPPGYTLTVEQAILAVVTKSANDVATMIGENLAGSEERFAQMMTLKARALGMSRTTFHNASGLPDPEQMTTARDMAILGRRLYLDFPDRYHYFATKFFRYGKQVIRGHNRMIGEYDGVDGIKTGFISASGFNIVTSAERQGVRLVAAVFGGSSWVERDRHAALLLDQGFERMGVEPSERPTLVARAPVISGRANAATLSAARRQNVRQVSTRKPAVAQVRAGTRERAARTAKVARNTPVRRVIEQGDGGRSIRAPATTSVLRRVSTTLPRPVPRVAAPARQVKPQAKPVTRTNRRG